MPNAKTKTFSISDIVDLEKVDGWWAGLLRKGAKEICGIEWLPKGDLSWTLKMQWASLGGEELPFNVCMPAYSSHSLEDLTELLEDIELERAGLQFHLKMLKSKIEEWGIVGAAESAVPVEGHREDSEIPMFAEHLVDPSLVYGPSLDLMEKIMASEFLWPAYKGAKRNLFMLDARKEEVAQEICHRADPTYSVVHVDRGMLRASFIKQIGYDNKWLFAMDDELMDDEFPEEPQEPQNP